MFFKALVVVLTVLSIVYSLKQKSNDKNELLESLKSCQKDHTFDYLLLALQWTPTFCASKKCGDLNRNEWTIHGVWPQNFDNSWPQYCCFERTFNVTAIKPLENELVQKWPTLKAKGSHEAFWRHEWTKHGTCAMNSLPLKGHLNYFNQTLNLFDDFPLQLWLNFSGIYPSNTNSYNLSAIHESVEQRIGNKRVELECLPKKPVPLLQQIYLCLDKNTLNAIDCPRADDKQCGNSTIRLPDKIFKPVSNDKSEFINHLERCQKDHTFDYLLLAIQWNPSFCTSKKCGDLNRNEWTIHGVWPQNFNNSWPQYCCFESTFNVTAIKPLESELVQKWPTLKANGSHEAFWRHEWTKHGTCAMNSLPLKGHLNYFNQTLNLFDDFPLQLWLNSSGILPTNTNSYNLSAIHESVEQRIGNKRVELECLPKKPVPLLQQIYLCLDKNTLDAINCPRADDKQCGDSTVMLPANI